MSQNTVDVTYPCPECGVHVDPMLYNVSGSRLVTCNTCDTDHVIKYKLEPKVQVFKMVEEK